MDEGSSRGRFYEEFSMKNRMSSLLLSFRLIYHPTRMTRVQYLRLIQMKWCWYTQYRNIHRRLGSYAVAQYQFYSVVCSNVCSSVNICFILFDLFMIALENRQIIEIDELETRFVNISPKHCLSHRKYFIQHIYSLFIEEKMNTWN